MVPSAAPPRGPTPPARSPPSPAAVGGGSARRESLLLAAVVALQLLPLLLLPYLPTQDGPSHQALAYALRVYERPQAAPLREYLVPNAEALPNWFVFFLQARVLAWLSTRAAETVLVAAYVVLLPLALRYALRGVDPGAGFLAALGLPFTFNFLFAMGFLNFCWSLPAFLFALGFHLRHGERFTARHALALAALAGWVYLCHPVTLVMLFVAVATLGGCRALADVREAGWSWRGLVRAAWARLALPLAAFVPVLALLAAFVGRRLDRPTSRLRSAVVAKQLAALYSLVSFDRRTLAFALALAALLATLAGLAVWRRRSGSRLVAADALLVAAALFAAVDFAAPSDLAGGGFVNHRLALFPPLALLLWLGGGGWTRRERRAVQLLGAAIAVGLLALLWARWARIDAYLEEYVAVAERVEDGRTVLPLGFAPAGRDAGGHELAFRLWPFVHALGYVAGRRPIVDLGLYEASEDYFPLRFRPQLDPYRHLSNGLLGVEEVPPRVDIPGFERLGGRVDYVLLWQPRAAPAGHPATRALYRQLDAGFHRVGVSAHGNAELWERLPR